MKLNSALPKAGLAAAGLVAGVVLASAVGASAASPSPSPTSGSASTGTTTSGTTTEDPHPGDNGADGVPESQEHHDGRGGPGGFGHGLELSGTVTAVGPSSVTIKTASGTTTYAVTSSSDIDKNGEAQLADLAVGDAVTFSADGTTVDKLHAGDEAKNAPAQGGSTAPTTTTSPSA